VWDEIVEHLPRFESAVLTGLDAEGYPFSVRCRPRINAVARVLEVHLPAGIPVRPGPASLLCHRHDENLWHLRSFLVRGELNRDGRGWTFRPQRFVPGAGIGGPMGVVRFFVGSRRTARRYLEKRGLSRPRVPWEEIRALKAQARASTDTDREVDRSASR
jgi:hypothetical protein